MKTIEVKGEDLDFISRIKADGSDVDPVKDHLPELLTNEIFTLKQLSISERTYIAHSFNSYVVRFK